MWSPESVCISPTQNPSSTTRRIATKKKKSRSPTRGDSEPIVHYKKDCDRSSAGRCNLRARLRTHRPLQEGLRRYYPVCNCIYHGLRTHRPLQEGLRPLTYARGQRQKKLRTHRPLQEGLRHSPATRGSSSFWILRTHRPLQEGLRHLPLVVFTV